MGTHQNGFIKNRSILDNILDIEITMDHYNKQANKGALLFLDQQKTFDRVDHQFLLKSIQEFGFNQQFTRLIQNLYKNQSSFLNLNGNTSGKFNLYCGVWQGDPLSPLFYTISLEPFLRKINASLKGLQIGQRYIKARAFADNTVIVLDNSDWIQFKRLLSLYELCSNAKINNFKSKLICFSNPSSSLLQTFFPFQPIDNSIPIKFWVLILLILSLTILQPGKI